MDCKISKVSKVQSRGNDQTESLGGFLLFFYQNGQEKVQSFQNLPIRLFWW